MSSGILGQGQGICRAKEAHENKTVFKEIVSKKPIRGIASMTELSPKAVYDKIDFIHGQCLGLVGDREARAHSIHRKYVRLCVDRQDYLINWKRRRKRDNVQFTSICTVKGKSGYILGHHFNFDPYANPIDVNDIASLNGDRDPRSRTYFHAQPQYWKSEEFTRIGHVRQGGVILWVA
jgi:hypothetical protein